MTSTFRRRHLPHWDVADAKYFVTACLSGSIPAAGSREVDNYRRELEAHPRPPGVTEDAWERRIRKLVFAKIDELLDERPAVRHLDNPDLAAVVRDGIEHFAGIRYLSSAFVVMPSHLHWVFRPLPEWYESLPVGRTPREVIMHSLKSFTANRCNEILGTTGRFWQDESYDHWIRGDDELSRILAYVEGNPVKAGLAADPAGYVFSSAYGRRGGSS